MNTPLESSGQVLYLASNSTNTGSWSLGTGRLTTLPTSVIELGPTQGERARGLELTFFGVGTAGQAFNWRALAIEPVFKNISPSSIMAWERQVFATGTATLGATAGAEPYGLTSTNLLCDGCTAALSTFGTVIKSAYAGAAIQAHNPGSGEPARVIIPEFGNAWGVQIEFDNNSTTTSANCYWKRTR